MMQQYFQKFPIQFTHELGEDFSEYDFSKDHIPLVRFNRTDGWQHNPVTVCQFALYKYSEYIDSNNAESRQIFLQQANWLIKNADETDDGICWFYHVDIPFYHINQPWISGMAQGEALAVLVRAHSLTSDNAFLQAANKAWRLFEEEELNQRRIVARYPDDAIAFEEYPSNPASLVLNGYLLGLLGVRDFAVYVDHEKALEFWERCVAGLKQNLFRYDTGYWSLYDLWKPARLASVSYHRLHIALLKILGQMTNEDYFDHMADKWNGYLNNPLCRTRWILKKILYRLTHA